MKTFILPIIIVLACMSCEEDSVRPADRFAGSWHFISTETQIEVSFDVVKDGSIYNFTNRFVIHPAIPIEEQDNNQIKAYEKFADGSGFGRIEITSRGYTFYKVILIYNRFTDSGDMLVYDVQIDIPSEPFIVLNDQVFVRK